MTNLIYESKVLFFFITSEEFENIYILYVYTYAQERKRERKPVVGKQDRDARSVFSNRASPGQCRLRVSRSREHLAFPNNGQIPRPRVLSRPALHSAWWRLLDRDERNIRSPAGFSDVEVPSSQTEIPAPHPLMELTCAGLREPAWTKEGRKDAEWSERISQRREGKDVRVSWRDVIKHVARGLNSIGRTSAYCTQRA